MKAGQESHDRVQAKIKRKKVGKETDEARNYKNNWKCNGIIKIALEITESKSEMVNECSIQGYERLTWGVHSQKAEEKDREREMKREGDRCLYREQQGNLSLVGVP